MPAKPNLLFIFTDEQRFDTMACYGNTFVDAPNLNALAEQSFVFEHPYVVQPVCTPARSTIMTGLYPHTNGCVTNNIPLKPETPTLAEMVDPNYKCAYYGKWHLGDEVIAQHGFEDWEAIEDNYRDYYSQESHLETLSDYHHFLVQNGYEPEREAHGANVFGRGTAARMPEELTKASFLGQEASRFIRENKDNPFVLYVNFLEPHAPFFGPLDDHHDPDAMPTGPHFLRLPEENASRKLRSKAEQFKESGFAPHDLTSEAGWRKLRAQYLGLVTLVDRAVGKILTALEESGQADNTICVFTSDHGDMMGDHYLLTKGVLYEESVKVPFLLRVPGLTSRKIPGRFSQIDLVPTLLDLLGEPISKHLEGKSRVPTLRSESTLDDAFIQWNQPNDLWRTVVSSEGWKLNLSPNDQCEFYDLNTDPHELQNLFDDPSRRDHVLDLTNRISQWQERYGDEAQLPSL